MAETEDLEHRVETNEPEPGQMRALVVDGHEILLCNVDGELYALRNACSHATTRLEGGQLRGHRLECPLHGAIFDVRSGNPLTPPARKPLEMYRVQRARGGLVIRIPRQPGGIPLA